MVLVDQTTWMYYHKNGHNRYRCYSYVTNGCVAGVVEEEDGIFVPTESPHVHPNHKAIIHEMMLFQAIKDEHKGRPVFEMRSSLQRVRRSRHPPNPLTSWHFTCAAERWGNKYRRYLPHSPNTLLSTNDNHALAYGHCFPVAYALMTGKVTALYELVIDRIKAVSAQVNVIPLEPKLMISDYEIAILTAVAAKFPNGRARGCYFHQSQNCADDVGDRITASATSGTSLYGILQKVDAAETLDFNNARNGEAIRRPRGVKDRRRQSRILQATAKLNRMEYTISEFLEIVSKEFEPMPIFNEEELIEAPALDLQLDDVFIRVLNPDPNVAPLPVVEPLAYIHPPPLQRGRRRVRGVAQNRENERIIEENMPHPGRAERHRRRQQLIDINRRNNGVLPMKNVQQAVLPQQGNLDVLPEKHGIDPAAPAARNVHLCVVCNINEIDCFLQCGHPFCTHCIAALRNINAPEPSLCPRCRAPFREATRIFF
ncbi:hypothetical protein DAPPUDRAFT_111401 [Daphnia pulex]|uniref:RING-type domain-containing protein n=1 Tax=Daphnia pulex TaxID=6669 RepID=E9H917_DAPPU|nr:hypothetical protein DAPPUDRAFT_111401 [Daphnia pulex]|eukprot:EFX71709.1 hypothetical protein DAPPUDRAFT_111401 [Daphnia pulex]